MRKIVDYYSKKAKKENYSARSVYKLMEMNQKYKLIKKGMKVLDIGCSPGSWSQYTLKQIGHGNIVGIDILDRIEVKDKRFSFIKSDLFDVDINQLKEKEGDFDLILSDIAPNTSGDKFLDSQISLRMLERVFDIAKQLLKPGRNVVAKVFQGEDLDHYIKNTLKQNYEKIIRFKPKSSRKESKEIYLIAFGKKE